MILPAQTDGWHSVSDVPFRKFPMPLIVQGITFRAVNGLLGLTETPDFAKADEVTCERPEAVRAWKQIEEWCRAAAVKRNLQWARFGFLGGYYSGMLDMYSDFTMLQAQTGIDIEVLEMSDLDAYLKTVTEEEVQEKLKEIQDFFEISGDSPSDPIAKKPTEEQAYMVCKGGNCTGKDGQGEKSGQCFLLLPWS